MAISDERTMSNESRMSPNASEEKSRSRRSHFFSRSLSRGSFSWSFVRTALQPASRNGALATSSCSCEEFPTDPRSCDSNSMSSVSDDSSDACSSSSRSSSTSGSSSSSRRSKESSGKRKARKLTWGERKPVLVEKIPFGKFSKYLTVYVGPRIEQSEKYVISRTLLTHPLFQVLLKCSADELGEDFSVDKGVAIVCDPALFLRVVRAVDDSMWNEALSTVPEDDG